VAVETFAALPRKTRDLVAAEAEAVSRFAEPEVSSHTVAFG
jgi:hypothetical protein